MKDDCKIYLYLMAKILQYIYWCAAHQMIHYDWCAAHQMIHSEYVSGEIKQIRLIRLDNLLKQQTWKHWYEGWNFNSGNYLFTTDTK